MLTLTADKGALHHELSFNTTASAKSGVRIYGLQLRLAFMSKGPPRKKVININHRRAAMSLIRC